ncbi:MAG: cyclodeaminase/cyclohydrolase family protein [Anaerolineae bacterium]
MIHQSVEAFLNSLAGSSATPGGGSVAALNGAMGAALVSMVCNLTIGKKKYAAVEAEAGDILRRSEALRRKLSGMIAADSAAFDGVMAAFGLPRQTEAEKARRAAAIESAFKKATVIPLETARACADVIALGKAIAPIGNANALSDAGAGALAAQAGLKGAALNVLINLGSIKDTAFVAKAETDLTAILTQYPPLADEVFELVKASVQR